MEHKPKVKHYEGCRGKGRVILRLTLDGCQWRCTECGDFASVDPNGVAADVIRGTNSYFYDSLGLVVEIVGRPLPKGMTPGIVGFWVRRS